MKIICPVCGKELSPETNDEYCPNSPYGHGKHPICVIDFREMGGIVPCRRIEANEAIN
jgi:hypothetical protein